MKARLSWFVIAFWSWAVAYWLWQLWRAGWIQGFVQELIKLV